MAHRIASSWHPGETKMHSLLRVPEQDNPTSPFLTPHSARILTSSPLLALGALDKEGRPWTTIWGGEVGFMRRLGGDLVGVRSVVGVGEGNEDGNDEGESSAFDPVVEALFGSRGGDINGGWDHDSGRNGNVIGVGKMVSGLAIDLQKRNRAKLYGKMEAGALSLREPGSGEVQFVMNVEQSLGNCPKYLNKKQIEPVEPSPKLISNTLPLPQGAVKLVQKADLFFISSSNHEADMDTNHRGGPPGFIRISSNGPQKCTLVYPEYSGNRLYQTLGNLYTTPMAGLAIPDFETGDILYITGRTEILIGKEAADVLPRCNLAVEITVEKMRFVEGGMGVRAKWLGEFSPYNPPVRPLAIETKHLGSSEAPAEEQLQQLEVKLIARDILTPTIARLRFQISDPADPLGKIAGSIPTWKAGQYVALGFDKEMDIGYSHMRDDDPKSLNDDYMRTFTVSSPPPTAPIRPGAIGDGVDKIAQEISSGRTLKPNEFEITIRKVGKVTDQLFKQNLRAEMEIGFKGFGGDFVIDQAKDENTGFVAAGVGITPLLGQGNALDIQRLRHFWTVRAEDLELVVDTFERIPGLKNVTRLFITGSIGEDKEEILGRWEAEGVGLKRGRMDINDCREDMSWESIRKWYICVGPTMRASVLDWLSDKEVFYEDFNY